MVEPKPKVDIVIDEAYSQCTQRPPLFIRQNGVEGKVEVIIPHGSGARVEKVKITLRGCLTNAIGHRCETYQHHYDVLYESNFLELVDVQTAPDPLDDDTGSTTPSVQSYPFRFELKDPKVAPQDHMPQHDTGNTSLKSLSSTLPSTLALRIQDGTFCPHANYNGPQGAMWRPPAPCVASTRVRYEIIACTYDHADEIITSSRREVSVFDAPELEPAPVHVEGFAGEYVMEAGRGLKRKGGLFNLRTKSNMAVSIVAEVEPAPLVLPSSAANRADAGETAIAVKIPLRFEVFAAPAKGKSSPGDFASTPGPLTINISSVIRSTTFVSIGAMDKQPTLASPADYSAGRAWTAQIPRYGVIRSTTLQIDDEDWVLEESAPELKPLDRPPTQQRGKPTRWSSLKSTKKQPAKISPAPQKKYTARKTLYFLHTPGYAPLPPTFFSPHLSRRYAVALRLEAAGKRHGRATVRLVVPIAVVYGSTDGREEEEAPKYEEVIRPRFARHDSMMDGQMDEGSLDRAEGPPGAEGEGAGDGAFEAECAVEMRKGVPPVYVR